LKRSETALSSRFEAPLFSCIQRTGFNQQDLLVTSSSNLP
jgi:hypothetical protein